MKRISIILFIWAFILFFTSCASVRPPVITNYENEKIENYNYFYVTPTNGLSSSSGIYADRDVILGGTTKSINPSDVISGILIKNGYIRVNEVNSDNASKTMVVNFGESGRRSLNLGYTIEVTIQFINAETQKPIVVCTAEGQGDTEADDIRKAINRALNPLFNK